MLILVGVTINVTAQMGIFGRAETATKETNKAAEREELNAAVITAYEPITGVINKQKLENELGEKWNVEGVGPYKVRSPKLNIFMVTAKGEISDGSGNEMQEEWRDNGNGTFTKGDTTVEVGKTTYTNAEVQEKLGATGGTYKGTWTVIGVEGDKLKLLSTGNVTDDVVPLGNIDENVYEKDSEGKITNNLKSEIVDLNGDEDLEFEKAVWSYLHAVDTLNSVAKEATGIPSAESITIEDIYNIIGENNIYKGTDYGQVYNYYYNKDDSSVYSKYKIELESGETTWSVPENTGYSSQTFVNDKGEIVIIDSEGDEVQLTSDSYSDMPDEELVNKLISSDNNPYWLSSNCKVLDPSCAGYSMRCFDGMINIAVLFYSYGEPNSGEYCVRAVVSI